MAFRLVDTVRELGSTALWRLMLPAMARRQHDIHRLQETVDRSLALSALVLFPVIGALLATIAPAVELLLGAGWLPSGRSGGPAAVPDDLRVSQSARRRRRGRAWPPAIFAVRQYREHGGDDRGGVAHPPLRAGRRGRDLARRATACGSLFVADDRARAARAALAPVACGFARAWARGARDRGGVRPALCNRRTAGPMGLIVARLSAGALVYLPGALLLMRPSVDDAFRMLLPRVAARS